MSRKAQPSYYLVQYRDPKDGQIVSLKAGRIEDSTLGLSFIRISEFIFDTNSVVVQPTKVQLQQRFENVRSLHLSIYSVVAIEERGLNHGGLKFKKAKSNLISFPGDNPNK